jgi:predicted dehydrogenase
MAWSPGAPRTQEYAFDARNGVTALSVSTGHALDALTFVLGGITSVTSTLAVGRDTVELDDGTSVPVTSPDQIAVTARLDSGAVASIFYRGGLSRAGGLRWEINGTEGDLLLTSPTGNGNMQATELVLAGANGDAPRVVPIDTADPDSTAGLSGPASTVAKLYRAFARDRAHGTTDTPSFGDALELHRLLAGIERGRLS